MWRGIYSLNWYFFSFRITRSSQFVLWATVKEVMWENNKRRHNYWQCSHVDGSCYKIWSNGKNDASLYCSHPSCIVFPSRPTSLITPLNNETNINANAHGKWNINLHWIGLIRYDVTVCLCVFIGFFLHFYDCYIVLFFYYSNTFVVFFCFLQEPTAHLGRAWMLFSITKSLSSC